MIAPQPFFEPRGTPISVRQRLAGLSKLGHEIDLATYHLGEDVSIDNVTIHRTPALRGIESVKVGPSWEKIPLDVLLFFKSVKLLLLRRYDVIHSHEEAGFFAILLAWIFRKKHVYDMHSSLPRQLVNFNFGANKLMISMFEYLERLVINTCDALITIGPDLENYVRGINANVPHQMIENLPLEMEVQEGETPQEIRDRLDLNEKMVIVYTGTFERYQGVDVLIQSIKSVHAVYPQIKIILVGGKPDQIEIFRVLVETLGLSNSIILTGSVSIDEANKYIETADILVSPRIEGTSVPLKIYTYLKAGKPIMATNIQAHTIVLDETTAVLVEPTDEAFSDGLVRLIRDKDLRASLSAKCRRLANEKYSETNYLEKLESIYQGIIRPTQGRPEEARS